MSTQDLVAGRVDPFGNVTAALEGTQLVRPLYSYHRSGNLIIRDDLIGFEWWHDCSENPSWTEVIYPAAAKPCPICSTSAPDTTHVEATIATSTLAVDPPDLPFLVTEA